MNASYGSSCTQSRHRRLIMNSPRLKSVIHHGASIWLNTGASTSTAGHRRSVCVVRIRASNASDDASNASVTCRIRKLPYKEGGAGGASRTLHARHPLRNRSPPLVVVASYCCGMPLLFSPARHPPRKPSPPRAAPSPVTRRPPPPVITCVRTGPWQHGNDNSSGARLALAHHRAPHRVVILEHGAQTRRTVSLERRERQVGERRFERAEVAQVRAKLALLVRRPVGQCHATPTAGHGHTRPRPPPALAVVSIARCSSRRCGGRQS